jgi:hypothetical protein
MAIDPVSSSAGLEKSSEKLLRKLGYPTRQQFAHCSSAVGLLPYLTDNPVGAAGT